MQTRHALIAAVLLVAAFSLFLPAATYFTGYAIIAERQPSESPTTAPLLALTPAIPDNQPPLEESAPEHSPPPNDAGQLITEVERGVEQAQRRWLDVPETQRALRLARSAYERQEYETAFERAKDAQLLLTVETSGKVTLRWLMKRYWWIALTAMIGLMFTSLWAALRIELRLVYHKLKKIDHEERGLLRRLKEIQIKHYQQKKMTPLSFLQQSQSIQAQLAKLRQERVTMRHQRMGILMNQQEAKSLVEEYEDITHQLTQLQQNYFLKHSLPPWEFKELHKTYKVRLAEIEEQRARLENTLFLGKKNSATTLLSVINYFYSKPAGLALVLIVLGIAGLGIYVSPTFSLIGSVVAQEQITPQKAGQELASAWQAVEDLTRLGVGVEPLTGMALEAQTLLNDEQHETVQALEEVGSVTPANAELISSSLQTQWLSKSYSLSKQVLITKAEIEGLLHEIQDLERKPDLGENPLVRSRLLQAKAELSLGRYPQARELVTESKELYDAGEVEEVRRASLSGLSASLLGAWVVQAGGVLIVLIAGCVPVVLWFFSQHRRGFTNPKEEIKILGKLNRQAQEDYFLRKKIGRDTFAQRVSRYQQKVDSASKP